MKKILFVLCFLLSASVLALELGSSPNLPAQLTDSYQKTHVLERGKWWVFFFYPRVGTSGCTAQNIEYTKLYEQFLKADSLIFGVSTDSARSQCAFIANNKLKVPQIPNAENTLGKTLEVSNTLGFFSRDTIIIAPSGKVAAIRQGVNPVSDAQEVLAFIMGNGNCKALTSGTNKCGK